MLGCVAQQEGEKIFDRAPHVSLVCGSASYTRLPEMLVLRLLAREEMYGYQLVAAIRQRSGEALAFGEGCIYPVLHKLAANGYLGTRRGTVDGRPRYYYKLSAKGTRHLDSLSGEWNGIVRGVQSIMEVQYA